MLETGVDIMNLSYETKNSDIIVECKKPTHFPPHIHEAIEMVYVTKGSLDLGVGQELYHMEKGDFAIVFPNIVHHYQVFSEEMNRAVYVYSPLNMTGKFSDTLMHYSPKNPVIQGREVHPDVVNAIKSLVEDDEIDSMIEHAYLQIMLARSLPMLELEERIPQKCDDIIYQTICYIAGHFKENLYLEKMAKDIGVNKFSISKVFSEIFHSNFNQYLNEQRIHYVCSMLEYSDYPITQIAYEAGFQSQRTFNRAFKEMFQMTPRQYRNQYKERNLIRSN